MFIKMAQVSRGDWDVEQMLLQDPISFLSFFPHLKLFKKIKSRSCEFHTPAVCLHSWNLFNFVQATEISTLL